MAANPKGETVSFESIVNEALARMKDATAATPSYEVDRSSGQWIVRRASSTSAIFAADAVAEVTANTE
jgi:hypothetical protein